MAAKRNKPDQSLADRETECHLALGVILGAQRGVGQAVVFEGPRGAGKTALLDEIARRTHSLMPEALILRARFRQNEPAGDEFVHWTARLAAACLGEDLPEWDRTAPFEAISALASRRGEVELRRRIEQAAEAAQDPSDSSIIEVLVELGRSASKRLSQPVIFFLDDIHWLNAQQPRLSAAVAEAVDRTDFAWVATSLPGQDNAGNISLSTAFRRTPMGPLDLPGATMVVERLAEERGRTLAPDLARALGSCLEGHGALSESFARELALSADPEPSLDAMIRLLVESFEKGAFGARLSAEFRLLFPDMAERADALEALGRLAESADGQLGMGRFAPTPDVLINNAGPLRALGLLDWQTEAVAPTPFWVLRQLISFWSEQLAGRYDASTGRFWRGAEVLRRVTAVAPAGEADLNANALAACLGALSGAELDESHFVVLPDSLAPSRRLCLPQAIVAEPLRRATGLPMSGGAAPPWMALSGMLGLETMTDNPGALGDMAFWVVAAFSPPVTVTGDDVRHVRRMAESLAMDAAGLRVSGVWVIGGSFRSTAERMAESEGVALTTWRGWRALNGLPMPTAAQMEAEEPTVVDPSGRSFTLDLSRDADSETPATDAAEKLAETGGFPIDQCREIHEAVRRGCQTALEHVKGVEACVRVRGRLENGTITVAVEHETPRWRSGEPNGAAGANWNLAPLKSRMDEVLTEKLPWGSRLTLRKRLDPFLVA